MGTVGRLGKDGNLSLVGEIDERSPIITDGLVAHFPFDYTDESDGEIREGLVSHWKLDGNLLDSSGNDNHLKIVYDNGLIIPSYPAKIGSGCYERTTTETSADHLISEKKVNLTESFTMSCWALVAKCTSSANGLVTNHNHGTNIGAGITVKYIDANDYRISCNTGSGTGRTYHTYYGTTNIKDKWSHLAIRFTSETNTLSLWVNGVQEKEVNYTMLSVEDYVGVFSWSLGYNTSSNYKPKCKIDDVRIYNRSLSDREMKKIYTYNQFKENLNNTYNKNGLSVEEPTTNISPYNGSFSNCEGIHLGDISKSNATKTNLSNDWNASSHYSNSICEVLLGDTPIGLGNYIRWTKGSVDGWTAVTSRYGWFADSSKTYTVSVYVRVNGNADVSGYAFYGDSLNRKHFKWEKTPKNSQNEWVRGTLTFSPTTSQSGGIYLYGDSDGEEGSTIDYCLFQIEEKTFATSFTQNSREKGSLSIDTNLSAPFSIHLEFTPTCDNEYYGNYSTNVIQGNTNVYDLLMWKRNTEDYYRLRLGSADEITFLKNEVEKSKKSKITIVCDIGQTIVYLNGKEYRSVVTTIPSIYRFDLSSYGSSTSSNCNYHSFSIYNKLLTSQEVDLISNKKYSITKDGNLLTKNISEVENFLPNVKMRIKNEEVLVSNLEEDATL